jgi:hypothetical protein
MGVVEDRCLANASLAGEVPRECTLEARLRILRWDRDKRRDFPRVPEVAQELLQHRSLAAPEASASSDAVAGKIRQAPFIQVRGAQALSIKPTVQVAKKPELVPAVVSAVALFEEESRETIHMDAKWSTPEALDGPRVLEEPCRHNAHVRAPKHTGWAGG